MATKNTAKHLFTLEFGFCKVYKHDNNLRWSAGLVEGEMRVFDRLRREITDHKKANCGRPPERVLVAGWRERYRLMIELRNLGRTKQAPWWQEHPADQALALERREMQKRADIRLYGVPVEVPL